MAEIRWTAEAQQWMREIFEYIAVENPEAAERTMLAIQEKVEHLRKYPKLGRRYAASTRHVRIINHTHYRIAYLLRDETSIDILGVFHGALDISRYRL